MRGHTRDLSQYLYVCLVVVFLVLAGWFFYIHITISDTANPIYQLWSSLYQVVALYGAIVGLFAAKKWGLHRSLLGKALLFFSISLFLQVFGQSVYSYYNYFAQIAVPYPSLGDFGFLGSTVCYIIAGIFLARTSGIKFSLKKSIINKIWVLLLPLGMLLVSYYFFLQGYQFDWGAPLKIIIDLGDPLGDAVYVSIALLALILCWNMLGGIMKKPMRLLIFALVFQYIADFTFLYQASNGTVYAGGFYDFVYLTSYFLMAAVLIYFGQTFNKIVREKN